MRVYWRPSFKHRQHQPILHARGLWELTPPATELSAIEALSGSMHCEDTFVPLIRRPHFTRHTRGTRAAAHEPYSRA